ncbi:TIGR02680 family protein [Nocardia sp. NPDC057668]|uniref:TIGR02680 family protein n=1 Tax=Nocardia sp. NPDC057668 TaxID=3346202 RepID=UPI0036727B03
MSVNQRKHFDRRWRLSRAGVVNVWHYLDTEFAISGGRLILRGTNGSGKSRALEMLLPFLLDANRRRMDATGSNRVNLEDLMRTGARGQVNRVGYLWLELARSGEFLTLGAHIKYSASAKRCEVRYFTTALRVGHELQLMGSDREPLAREALTELVGAQHLGTADQHQEVVRSKVFGLHGELGRDRFAGLMQLLHTLRAPDVGNRIDEGRLPQILSEALPPLSEQTLDKAGEQLDDLTETRLAQERLATTLGHVRQFHTAYRSYATTVLADSATTVDEAVSGLLDAQVKHGQLEIRLRGLAETLAHSRTREGELEETARELDVAIENMRINPLFKQADDLKQREKVVSTLRATAERALRAARTARGSESQAATTATELYNEVRRAAHTSAKRLHAAVDGLVTVGLAHSDLPSGITCRDTSSPVAVDTIMDSLDQGPVTNERPVILGTELRPGDNTPVAESARRCGAIATHRGDQAGRRRQEAVRLDREYVRVRELESAAEHARENAEHDHQDAASAAEERDDLAVALNSAWRQWLSAPETARLLPNIEWTQPSITAVLDDSEALCGANPAIDGVLASLDELAESAAAPFRDELAAQLGMLRQLDHADTATRHSLDTEAERLRAAHDPLPPNAPWHTTHAGLPLWRVVDFHPELSASDRAGLEAALLASGLLTATVRADGSVRTVDGAVMIQPTGDPARSPLSRALRADSATDLPTAFIDGVLERIGLADPTAVTTVSTDGSWRNGALAGRHHQPEARHIGATARASTRAARLAEIAELLGELDRAAADRDAERTRLRTRRHELDDQMRRAPRARELITARSSALRAAERAARSAAKQRTAQGTASDARTAWSAESDNHRTLCAGMGLPIDADELLTAEKNCATAASACTELATAWEFVTEATERARRSASDFELARNERRRLESEAEASRLEWHTDAVGLATLRETLNLPLEELTAELELTTGEAKRTKDELGRLRANLTALGIEHATTENDLGFAARNVDQRSEGLRTAAELFNARLRLPGVVAATGLDIDTIAHTTDPDHARHTARSAHTALNARKPFSVNQLLSALSRFGADTTGQLDVAQHVEQGVHLVHVDGIDDHHDCTALLSHLEHRVEQGRQALTQREREVFTHFVLGAVTDELRRRIHQARVLITAMNDSLAGTRTSHGIGVAISWNLDNPDPELNRLLALVEIADQVRSEADSEELITLVRDRVEALRAADPSSGYTTHLRGALDYRSWHRVDVDILGPGPQQRQRISRRAKISQGETRFVSYIALFAAADGYLSGLPEAATALRLVLLDDAFAKVDDKAIGELMGLLVRLDIDFVMTGHALWGTVPEVPALDIYEIRRIGGSAVIPTWIHWDGKNRTYMQAVRPG